MPIRLFVKVLYRISEAFFSAKSINCDVVASVGLVGSVLSSSNLLQEPSKAKRKMEETIYTDFIVDGIKLESDIEV
jgi:hypothetical protein